MRRHIVNRSVICLKPIRPACGGSFFLSVFIGIAGTLASVAENSAAPKLAIRSGLSSAKTNFVTGASLTFEQHIRPILKAHCFDCHGEGDKPKAGLDLRLRRFIVKGGETGPAIEPGHPERSELVEKIRSGEMPKRGPKLSDDEIQRIEDWIANGARTAHDEPNEVGPGILITEEERSHWAYRPIRPMAVPNVKSTRRIRTPIDAFLLSELSKRNLSFSPDADRITLVRRAYFDLIGVPPTPEEVTQFVEDKSPDAYERLIDRLLSSPHYGERWGRYWLDAAGYADSDGYTDADTPRDYAYKYRDFVIRSFNEDKPLDEFVIEQLAGDELATEIYTNRTEAIKHPATIEKLVATGFLRMGPDGTATPGVDADVARNQVVADTIKIVSTSLLGLSVGCAQCHDHRYDPIPQADYYRLRAVLEPAYDWKNWRNPAQRAISLYTEKDREKAAAVESEAKKLAAEKEEKQKKYIEDALEKHLEKFEAPLRESLQAALKTPSDKRTDEQKKLLADHPSVNINPGVLYQYNQKAADDLKAMDGKIAEVRARKPPEDFVQALTEIPGQIPVTHLFHRGDPKQPKEAIGPGALSVLAAPGQNISFAEKNQRLPSTGRRLAFSRWLVSGQDPLLPRVVVNRIWMHHFGRGIVGTPADFGVMGETPTHPALLDWLAGAFSSRGSTNDARFALGWSFKRLHKLIMTSTAYRQSSLRDARKEAIDPEDIYYWRKPILRLDAEAIRDSMMAASGVLNLKMFGPPVPVREDVVGQIVIGVDKKQGDNKMPVDVPMGGEEFRRSVYVQVRRSRPLAFLNSFDAPVMELNCERRQSSTVATQALMLMNSEFILDQARRFAERLRNEVHDNRRLQIIRAWQLAFARLPSETEVQRSTQFFARQIEVLKSEQAKPTVQAAEKKTDKATPPPKIEPETQALTDFCQALLSANEFLYVD